MQSKVHEHYLIRSSYYKKFVNRLKFCWITQTSQPPKCRILVLLPYHTSIALCRCFKSTKASVEACANNRCTRNVNWVKCEL